MGHIYPRKNGMHESNISDEALAELLALTVGVTTRGTYYRNQQGQLHRVHGPAVITHVGDQHWYQNGLRHRTDGPAIIGASGVKWWYQNGARHRTDGPAVTYTDDRKYWYIDDEYLTEREFHERIKTI